jgi:hypothetical protein
VDGGSEDSVFKFEVSEVSELRSGADCMAEVVPVELRGCLESRELGASGYWVCSHDRGELARALRRVRAEGL